MLLLAPIGIAAVRRRGNARQLLLMGSIIAGWILALIRLHATGGYCTSRHALIAALPIIGAGAAGVAWLIRSGAEHLERSGRIVGGSRRRIELLGPIVILGGLAAWWFPLTLAPLNRGYLGYRQAGEWLATHAEPASKVFDLKGWAIYYSDHPGYSFARIAEGTEDRGVRWLVAHDSLLNGPWFYCDIVRNMVQGRRPVASFPARPERGVARVHVFDLAPTSGASPAEVASKPRAGHETR
jgi:hypothetical protein